MTVQTRKQQLENMLASALAEQTTILAKIAPLEAEYNKLAEKMNVLDREQRPIGDKLKVLRAPLYELSKEITGYRTALNQKQSVSEQEPVEESDSTPE